MSLTLKQKQDTRDELLDNFNKSGLSIQKVADDLGTSVKYIQELFKLEPKRLEDTWILRNYLIEKVREVNKTPTPFTALAADYHNIWFLDARYIDGKKIIE